MRYGYMQNNHRLKARADREVRRLFLFACGIISSVFLIISL